MRAARYVTSIHRSAEVAGWKAAHLDAIEEFDDAGCRYRPGHRPTIDDRRAVAPTARWPRLGAIPATALDARHARCPRSPTVAS